MTGANKVNFSNCQHVRFLGSGSPMVNYGFYISGDEIRVLNLSSDIEIAYIDMDGRGMDIKDSVVGHEAHEMNNILVHHSYIHDYGAEAIYIGNSSYDLHPGAFVMRNARVYNNIIDNCGEGIQCGSVVEGCLIHHNVLTNITPEGAIDNTYGAIGVNQGTRAWVYNNIVDDCEGLGIADFDSYFATDIYNNLFIDCGTTLANYQDVIRANNDDNTVYNNTIINGGNRGIKFGAGSGSDEAFNNVILGTTNASIEPGGNPGGNIHDNDTKEEGHTVVNYDFVNQAAGNYRLLVTSPGVDAGSADAAPLATDLDDNFRPVNGTYDIGAYEYQG